MKTVEFVGVLSGDGEAFCWDVTPKEFKKATGEEPEKIHYKIIGLVSGPDGFKIKYSPNICRLYPNDVFNYRKGKFKFKIEFEEVENEYQPNPKNT